MQLQMNRFEIDPDLKELGARLPDNPSQEQLASLVAACARIANFGNANCAFDSRSPSRRACGVFRMVRSSRHFTQREIDSLQSCAPALLRSPRVQVRYALVRCLSIAHHLFDGSCRVEDLRAVWPALQASAEDAKMSDDLYVSNWHCTDVADNTLMCFLHSEQLGFELMSALIEGQSDRIETQQLLLFKALASHSHCLAARMYLLSLLSKEGRVIVPFPVSHLCLHFNPMDRSLAGTE